MGQALYLVEDYPDLNPNLGNILRFIRGSAQQGITLESLIEYTGHTKRVILEELKFLVTQYEIYNHQGKFFPTVSPRLILRPERETLIESLTRDELVALVKMFLRNTVFANELLEEAVGRAEQRRTSTIETGHTEDTGGVNLKFQ